MTMLELKQLEEREIFKDIVTIQYLMNNTTPPLAYGTIINAINKGKLVCQNKSEGQGGLWLIYLPSARNLWGKRFTAKELS